MQRDQYELDLADGCLAMIRDALERDCGLPMQGCPPMMYDDAIRVVVTRLGRAAGLHTWDEVRNVIAKPTALVRVS